MTQEAAPGCCTIGQVARKTIMISQESDLKQLINQEGKAQEQKGKTNSEKQMPTKNHPTNASMNYPLSQQNDKRNSSFAQNKPSQCQTQGE